MKHLLVEVPLIQLEAYHNALRQTGLWDRVYQEDDDENWQQLIGKAKVGLVRLVGQNQLRALRYADHECIRVEYQGDLIVSSTMGYRLGVSTLQFACVVINMLHELAQLRSAGA